nr:hypothetical protein [Acidobacteriota bacterium]
MLEQIKKQFTGVLSLLASQLMHCRGSLQSVYVNAFLLSLIAAMPLNAVAQGKAVESLQSVTVNSRKETLYGPFPEGVETRKTQPFKSVSLDTEDLSGHRRVRGNSLPTVKVGTAGVRPVATIDQAGPSAVAAMAKLHPPTGSQIQPLNINFGESVFFTPSQRSPAPTTVCGT